LPPSGDNTLESHAHLLKYIKKIHSKNSNYIRAFLALNARTDNLKKLNEKMSVDYTSLWVEGDGQVSHIFQPGQGQNKHSDEW
jgi:hypothetical protein